MEKTKENEMLLKFRLTDYTIVRNIMDKMYLNEVRKHVVLIMTLEAEILLNYLKEFRSFCEVKTFLKDNYEYSENIDQYCYDLIIQLYELGFLVINKNITEEIKIGKLKTVGEYDNFSNLEKDAIEKDQLLGVTIELTYKCNLQCRHCFIGEKTKYRMKDKQFYFNLIDELYEMGVLNIVFTGGEIFTRKDAIDIIEYAVKKNFLVDIFTNGTLIDDDLLLRLYSLKIHSIQASIYSMESQIHDGFVGKEGALNKTIEILQKASTAGIMTAIKTCVFNFNYREFTALKDFASTINAEFQYTLTILPRKDNCEIPKDYVMSNEDLLLFLNDNAERVFYEKQENEPICTAGQISLSISPEGKVYLCNAFDLEIGDLTNISMQNIWKYSEVLHDWKNVSMARRTDCRCCKYINYCDFCPGSAYKIMGDSFAKYETACEQAKSIYNISMKGV